MKNIRSSANCLCVWLVLTAAVFNVKAFWAPPGPDLPNFDKRALGGEDGPPVERRNAVNNLRARLPDVRVDFDQHVGTPKRIISQRGFLSGPAGKGRAVRPESVAGFGVNEPHRSTKAFLKEHQLLFGYGPEALNAAKVKRDFITPHSGLRTVVWEQELDGIPVFEGLLISHTTKNEELVNLSSGFIPNPAAAADAGTPNRAALFKKVTIAARKAVVLAAHNLGETLEEEDVQSLDAKSDGAEQREHFKTPPLSSDSEAKLVWLPMNQNSMRLCWEVVLTSRARSEMYRLLIDAQTGEALVRHRLTEYLSDATYSVFTSDSPSPFSPGCSTPCITQPALVSRTLVTLSALDTNASPLGWINDGGNETLGNNVDAHTDRDNNNLPDLPRPQGSPSRVFDFPINLSLEPITYTNGAAAELFYWCNWMHDKLYALGFTEAAGNFQSNNFGRGGIGNDALQADAQDGGGFNNANMSTSGDGTPPRMQMYLFNGPTPDRDGDFDHEVVLHEYTHGLSNRRVGGGVGLSALQSRGMGEGWSDWYALSLLSESGDDVNGVYAKGGYVTYLLSGMTSNYYFGIRRYPYCTDMTKNPLTFKDIDPVQANAHVGIPRSGIIGSTADEVHNQGEVWSVTLWDARANLIEKYGYATGNQLILRLVTDGMNLSPSNPNFLQARDGILQADVVYNGGADLPELWAAFAKRGMGYSATSPSSSTTAGLVEAYDVPDSLTVSPATGFTSSGPVAGPFSQTSRMFTLLNIGTNSLNWVASRTATWLALSQTNGTIAVGGSNSVTASLDSSAYSLSAGIYTNTVRFTNVMSGVSHSRVFVLRVGQPDFYTELFDGGDNDLDFQTLTFTPDGSTNFYSVCRTPATNFPTDPTGGQSLSLSSHTFVQLALSNNISIYGKSTNVIFLASEGHLTLTTGDSSGTVTLANHFSRARVSASLAHIHPIENGGTVIFQQLSNRAAITFNKVVEYATSNTNSFQIELFYDGRIRMTHLFLGTTTGLVGLSAGNGVPAGFLESDLSGYGPCVLPVVVNIPDSGMEGDGTLIGQGQVTVFSPPTTNVTFALSSSDTSEVTVPASVTMLAGQTTTNFDLTIPDDAVLDGVQPATISASAPNYAPASDTIQVGDNETATLSVSLPASVTEGAGTLPVGLVSASAAPVANITVSLNSSDTTEITVPQTVTLLAGQTSAVFSITVINDTQIDGSQNATVTAHVANWTDGSANVVVQDNEPTNLVVTLPASAREGNGVLVNAGTARISGTLPTNLVVSLLSSDTTELTVPATTTILAGQTSATFNLTIVDDPDIDSSQNVTVTASAPGFSNGATNMTVTDDESPPQPFNPSPPHLATNVIQSADLSWLSGAVPGEIITNDVYFGTNPTPGPAEFVGSTTGTNWALPNLFPQTVYYWQIVARKTGVTPGPVWQFTTRGVDHFVWDAISPTQYVNQPFGVTVTAKDVFETSVSNFTGTVALSGRTGTGPSGVTSILLFDDISIGRTNQFRVALNELGLAYQVFSNATEAAFTMAVTNATPSSTLVIVDSASNFHTFSNAITTFVAAGGRAIFEFWDLDTWPTVAAAFNATTVGEIATPIPVYNWGGSQIFAGLPNPVNFVETAYSDDGDRLNPIGGGIAVGGFVSSPTSGQAAVVIGNSGRTILNGFLLDNAQFGGNAVQLAKNEVQTLIGAGMSVAISPTNSGNFLNGKWSGNITVLQPTTNVVLRADDGSGHVGDSNPFTVELQNDISVAVTDSPDPVSLGAILTYTIFVTNIGPSSAAGVTVTNFLPATATLVAVTPSQGTFTTNGGVVVCNLGSMSGNSVATITVVATPIAVGTLTNQVMVSRSDADAYLANNAAVAITSVQTPTIAISDVTLYEGNVGTTNALFVVSVSPPPALPVSVNFATVNGSAVTPDDFSNTNGILTFLAGETNKGIVVPIKGEPLYELNETFTISLFSATNATLADSQGVGTILNDDPIPTLSIGDATVTEGNSGATNAAFPVSLSAASGINVTVSYATVNGNATSGTDYIAKSGSLTIPAGMTNTNIVVTVNGDLSIEPDEVFYVDLSSAANATLLKREGVGFIVNDDGLPGQLDHFVWNGIGPTQYVNAPFGATITAQDVFNNLATSFSGTANLTASGAGGLATNMILGNIVHSSVLSGNYTLGYSFTPNTNLTVTHVRSYSGTKVSIWTDTGTLLATQSVAGVGGAWTETPLASPLALTGGVTYRVTFYTGGGNYYWRTDGPGSFPDGTINASYQAAGDAFPTSIDSIRWWFVDLRYTVGAGQAVPISPVTTAAFSNGIWSGNLTVYTPATNTVLRADDGNGHFGLSSPFAVLLRDDISISTTDLPDPVIVGSGLAYTLTVSNTGPSSATGVLVTNILPPTVTLNSINPSQGTATNYGQTVVCNLGTLNGGNTATVSILVSPMTVGAITNRATVYRNETDAYLSNNTAVATTTVIIPVLSINSVSVPEGNVGLTSAAFTVALSPSTTQAVSVAFATANVTAEAGIDYVATNGVLNFEPGETNKAFAVQIIGDTNSEPTETFSVTLSSPTNAVIGTAVGTGTIVNDEVAGRVAVFGAPGADSWNEDVRQKIAGAGNFTQVDAFLVKTGYPVPTLAQLQEYSAVLVYSDASFNNNIALGDVLADYIDTGGVVVLCTFAFHSSGGISIQGRIKTAGYLPFSTASQSQGTVLTLVTDLPSHPILSGISSFNGGASSYHNSSIGITNAATLVAHWSNGQPLIGTKQIGPGRIVGLNFYPPSSTVSSDFWSTNTQGGLLMANALQWTGVSVPNTNPPVITTSPVSQSVVIGGTATFNVSAIGSLPLLYQWRKEGFSISGATNAAYTINSAQYSHAGNFSVVVSNAYGYANSTNATLIVSPNTSNLVINAFDTGWYDNSGFHGPGNANYYVGDISSGFPPLRDWAAFNIPSLPTNLITAQLRVNTYTISSPTGSEIYQVRHVSTPVGTLTNGGSGLISVYNDLADGVIYGNRTFLTSEANQFITMPLNSDFVTNLVAASGQLFAIGGEIASLDSTPLNSECVFSSSAGALGDVQLILSFATNNPPLVLSPRRAGGNMLRIEINNLGGSPITPARLAKIQLYSTTNIAIAFTNWIPVTNSMVLTNGTLQINGISPANSRQFFRTFETP